MRNCEVCNTVQIILVSNNGFTNKELSEDNVVCRRLNSNCQLVCVKK